MLWFCEACGEPVTLNEDNPCVKTHREKIVGIRPDIAADAFKRLVKDLRRTDRLVQFGKEPK